MDVVHILNVINFQDTLTITMVSLKKFTVSKDRIW